MSDRMRKESVGWTAVLVCLCAIVCGGLYLTLSFDFVSLDDNVNIFRNVWFKRPLLEALQRFWRAPFESLYIPFSYSVWRISAELGALLHQGRWIETSPSPSFFHGLNLALHLCNTVLVVRILARLLDHRCLPVLLGAVIFAMHPLQMETVAWISCLRDLLAYALGLSAILLLMEVNPKVTRILLATLCLILAALSKPNAVVLPLSAGVIWYAAGYLRGMKGTAAPFQKTIEESAGTGQGISDELKKHDDSARKSSFWGGNRRVILLGVWTLCLVPIVLINKSQQLDGGLQVIPTLLQRPWIAWDAIGLYLHHIVWPVGLTPDYGRSAAAVLTGDVSLSQIVTPLVPVGLILIGRRKKELSLAYLVFLVGLFPTLGIIPFQYQEFSTVTDRYVYFSMLGVGWFAGILFGGMRFTLARWFVLSVVMVACAGLGRRQIQIWKDSGTLFQHALNINPRSKIMAFSMANLHYEAGRYDLAEQYFKVVVEQWPRLPDVHLNLAVVYAASQRFEQALSEIEETLKLTPSEGNAWHLKGMVLFHLGDKDGSRRAFAAHLATRPTGAIANYSQAMLAQLNDDLVSATSSFEQVLVEQPRNKSAINQLIALYSRRAEMSVAAGLESEAAVQKTRALELEKAILPQDN